MQLPVICRTCDARESYILYELSTRPKKYPDKSLAEMLSELTEIDINAKLPNCICGDCTRKLRNAYDFVMQARNANELLLQHQQQPKDEPVLDDCLQESPLELYAVPVTETLDAAAPDCLLESPMELCVEPEMNFKCEMDDEIEEEIINSAELPEATIEESAAVEDAMEERKDPLVLIKLEITPLKSSPQKSASNQAATRIPNLSERKQAKAIDANMCRPHGFKLIQCMICHSQYDKISELRHHLEQHPEIDVSGEQQKMELSELIAQLYPGSTQLTETQLEAQIREDLAAGNYTRFYSITNQCGYEMDLDSSETESELEMDAIEQPRKRIKSKYVCELCQQRYPRKYQLYEHQRETHAWAEAPHVCGRCDARFVSLLLLTHHYMTQCKNTQKRYFCRHCPMRFHWRHNFRNHARSHRSTIQRFECTKCSRVFGEQKSLTVHLLSVHADKSKLLPCKWCSRKFYRRDCLTKHLRRHGLKPKDIPLAETLIAATAKPNGLKSISCKVCKLQFKEVKDLRAHLQQKLEKHHNYDSLRNYSITNESGFELQLEDSETEDEGSPEQLYVCELCQVQSRRKYEMMQHQRTMHRFDKMPHECELCIFKSVSKNIMDHHKLTQCLSKEKILACRKCGYKFMWKENLKQHMLLQHAKGLTPVSTDDFVRDKASPDIPQLQCPHCERTYQLQSRLNNHIRDVHINGDRKRKAAIKKFLCSLCGKETPSKASLVTHMRRHTGEKPFKCDMCERAFPRHAEMQYHRRVHTGEKPFHCTVCGKDFAHSHKLTRHMLTHSGLKPHKCTYCEKSYRQSKDLKLHLKQHTGECPFECGTCGERFIQSSTLEKHRMMRRHFDEVD